MSLDSDRIPSFNRSFLDVGFHHEGAGGRLQGPVDLVRQPRVIPEVAFDNITLT